MKKFCEVMVIAYIILFIPVSIYSSMFDMVSMIGAENANKTLVSVARFLMNSMPVIVFAAAGFGYALNKEEKFNISRIILIIPIIVFALIWVCTLVA